jgi:hypothetical protein
LRAAYLGVRSILIIKIPVTGITIIVTSRPKLYNFAFNEEINSETRSRNKPGIIVLISNVKNSASYAA